MTQYIDPQDLQISILWISFFSRYCKELIYKSLPEDIEDLEIAVCYIIEEDMMENV